MYIQYEETKERVLSRQKESRHVPPHLHDALEIIYVTEGSLEAGVGMELYHMETGDLAFVFPDVIHHYQAFSEGKNSALYIQVPSALCGAFTQTLHQSCPKVPVLRRPSVGEEVREALRGLSVVSKEPAVVAQAYVQIVLAKCLPKLKLLPKEEGGIASTHCQNLIHQTAVYVALHFRERLDLVSMASALGVSRSVLSGIFSGVFGCNFSRYVNGVRLHYACACLENTNLPVTAVWLDSGFDSQRTFNRAFKERYRMTPIEYRKSVQEEDAGGAAPKTGT